MRSYLGSYLGSYVGSYMGLMASLARPADALRLRSDAPVLFDVARLKSVISAGIQSTLSGSFGGTFPSIPAAYILPFL